LGLRVAGPSRESHVNGSDRLEISEPKMIDAVNAGDVVRLLSPVEK
jgi:hypothetical protein